jgi:F-type H+-transporting ATPase subunit delta
MANLSGIARPYALAAFEYAHEKQQLSQWKAFLEAAATVAKDKAVVKLLGNPEMSNSNLLALFNEVLVSLLDTDRKNFLSLLAQNSRLCVLPEISDAFNLYYAALEKISNVRVITAIQAEKAFTEKLTDALTKRIKRDVTLEYEVDPAIIAGAIIHIGDRVIDGSVRGKLSRLHKSLSA